MRCSSKHTTKISSGEETFTCVYKEGHSGSHQCADISWPNQASPNATDVSFLLNRAHGMSTAHPERRGTLYAKGADEIARLEGRVTDLELALENVRKTLQTAPTTVRVTKALGIVKGALGKQAER